jgi:hypothetical protein
MLRELGTGTHMGDIDVGDMFLNFILEARCSYLAGADLSKFMGGGGYGMGFRPCPYHTTQAIWWTE